MNEEEVPWWFLTKVIRKKGSAGQNLSGRARAIFTRAVNLRGFPPGVPTGWGRTFVNPHLTFTFTFTFIRHLGKTHKSPIHLEEAGRPDPRGSLGRSDAANETLSRAATPTAEAVSITRLGRSIGVGETSDEAHSQGPLGNKNHQIVTKAGLF